MRWRKLGQVFEPKGNLWWWHHYMHLPTAELLSNDIIRVYFAALDHQDFGRVGYVDLDAQNPLKVLKVAREPILDLGEAGLFDDSGVNPLCVIPVDTKRYMYYIGWQRSNRVPYLLFTGLAVDSGDGVWRKAQRVPVLPPTHEQPFLRSAISVIRDDGIFKGWHISGINWFTLNGKLLPRYVIRYATSKDGIVWTSYDNDHVCIGFESEDEFGFGRPWVVKDGDLYRMWYSVRSTTRPYRLGYAESHDGVQWQRLDHLVGIERSESGWDSEMLALSCIIDVHNQRYMFYNGNRNGMNGFGCAILERD
jgi:hypothetical protein